MRTVTVLFWVLVLYASTVPASAQKVLRLPSGVQVAIADMKESSHSDGRKGVSALLAVGNLGDYDDEQRSIIADQFFELYFGPFAEQKKYQFAQVGVGNSATDEGGSEGGFKAVGMYEYTRAENGVWEPGHDSVLDDEPLDKAQQLTLPSGTVVHVEFQGTAYVNTLQGEAFVIAFWTDVPLSDIPRLYVRAREYWMAVKDQVPAHARVSNVAAFDSPKLGYFHFRDAFIISLRRNADGSWPHLPENWRDAQQGQSEQIQASFREDRIRTIWPDR